MTCEGGDEDVMTCNIVTCNTSDVSHVSGLISSDLTPQFMSPQTLADITHKVIHDPLFVQKIFISNFSKLTETWMDGAEMLKGLRVARIMAHTWDWLIKISIYFVYIGFNNNYTSWLGPGVGGQIVACLLSEHWGPSPSSSISSLEPEHSNQHIAMPSAQRLVRPLITRLRRWVGAAIANSKSVN